jgi:hypothetical protein
MTENDRLNDLDTAILAWRATVELARRRDAMDKAGHYYWTIVDVIKGCILLLSKDIGIDDQEKHAA